MGQRALDQCKRMAQLVEQVELSSRYLHRLLELRDMIEQDLGAEVMTLDELDALFLEAVDALALKVKVYPPKDPVVSTRVIEFLCEILATIFCSHIYGTRGLDLRLAIDAYNAYQSLVLSPADQQRLEAMTRCLPLLCDGCQALVQPTTDPRPCRCGQTPAELKRCAKCG